MHPPAGAPAFKPQPPPYIRVAVPSDVPPDQGAEAFGRAIAPYLANDIQTPQGKRPLAVAVYVPAHGPLRLWTNGRNANALIDLIQQERTRQPRMTLLAAARHSARRRGAHRESWRRRWRSPRRRRAADAAR